MTLTELAFIIVYVSVLVIKTCDLSSVRASALSAVAKDARIVKEMCRAYGFGESADGATHVWAHVEAGACAPPCTISLFVHIHPHPFLERSLKASVLSPTRCLPLFHLLWALDALASALC